MAAKVDEAMYDKRLIERGLRSGTLSREQIASHLETLPDLAEQGELLDITVLEDELRSGTAPRGDGQA